MRRAFTLVELAVVTAIIVLMSSLAVPALSTFLLQQQTSTAVRTFSGAVLNTRAVAQSNFTTAAVRVERAFATTDTGEMIKNPDGTPRWLNHQQIRTVVLGVRQPQNPIAQEEFAFRQTVDKVVSPLPSQAWLAPDNGPSLLTAGSTLWQPPVQGAAPLDTLDTFYVVFNRQGELASLPASRLVYVDETQNRLFIGHPQSSVAGVIAYNRDRFIDSGRSPAQLQAGIPLYIDRYNGEVVKGEQRK